MKKYLFVLFSMLPLVGCDALTGVQGGQKTPLPAVGTASPAPSYFPLTVGSTWQYKKYTGLLAEDDGGVYEGYYTNTVVSTDAAMDGISAVVSQTNYGKDGQETSSSRDTYTVKSDGVYLKSSVLPNAIKRWPLPLALSETALDSATTSSKPANSFDGASASTTSATILRVFSVGDLAVGNYTFKNAWQVDRYLTRVNADYTYPWSPIEESTYSYSLWLAPNVGVVKTRSLTEDRTSYGASIGQTTRSRTSYEISTYSIRP